VTEDVIFICENCANPCQFKEDEEKLAERDERLPEMLECPTDEFVDKDEALQAEPEKHEKLDMDMKFLDDIMDSGESKVKVLPTLSGILQKEGDEIFYQTVFAQKAGMFTPIVMTSRNGVLLVHTVFADEKGTKIVSQSIEYEGFEYEFRNIVKFDSKLKINTIDNDGIKNFRKNIVNEKDDIYSPIVNEIKSYFYHDNPFEYDIAATAVIQSYIYQVIGRVFYYVLQGKPGTGKSVMLNLLSYLSMNGRFGGKTSIPVGVRMIDIYGITLCQDEIDKLSDDDKKTLVGVFNNGYNTGGSYNFVNTGQKNIQEQIISLDTFCPKNFAANDLQGFADSMLDRCYIVVATKTKAPLKDIYQLRIEDLHRFQDIRNNTFCYCIIHWISLFQDIDYVKNELMKQGIFGRDVDKPSIILGIIKHFKGEEYAKKVWAYMKEKLPTEEIEEHNRPDEIVLEAIVSMYEKDKYVETLEVQAKWLYAKLSINLIKCSNQAPTHILKNLGVISEKSERKWVGGCRVFIITTEKLRRVLERNNYKLLSVKIPPKPTKPK